MKWMLTGLVLLPSKSILFHRCRSTLLRKFYIFFDQKRFVAGMEKFHWDTSQIDLSLLGSKKLHGDIPYEWEIPFAEVELGQKLGEGE